MFQIMSSGLYSSTSISISHIIWITVVKQRIAQINNQF